MNGELLERAAALRAAGQPFVLATVVRSVKPASARPGDGAILVAGSPLNGWVGGGCVQTTIETEARHALSDGRPRLVRLSPDADPTRAGVEEEGVLRYPMTCHSGGTLEIYLEPMLPAPELVVLGDSPVAHALSALARPLGFRVTLDPSTPLALARPEDAWVVVAGMGHDDDAEAVRAAVESGAQYVAFVASRRRAAAIVATLRADGVAADALDRLKAPAGLDIGATSAPEIALSILAEIVQLRRAAAAVQQPAETPAVAIDPICGMTVEIASARWTLARDGQTFYFCAPGCKRAFEKQLTA